MKLLFMRHAHADTQNDLATNDVERTITKRGMLEANDAAYFLGKQNFILDKILVSPTVRTVQTLELLTQKVVTLHNIEQLQELYNGTHDQIIHLLSCQQDIYKNILVIGHNPLIYNIALTLSESNSTKYEALIESSMPTARIIVINFPTIDSWKKLDLMKGDIEQIFTANPIDC